MSSREELQEIIEKLLVKQFGKIDIESIDIQPDVDEDGDDILFVRVVFDSKNNKPLDALKASSFVRHLRPKILDAGETAFPVLSFIAKSELENLKSETV